METKRSFHLHLRSVVITAMCIALAVVFPLAFHAIPNAGKILSPIHIPVFLCGLSCGPIYGLICGILGPLLGSVITSMPPLSVLPPMMIECAVYGFAAGLFMYLVRTKRFYLDLYISLICAMLLGRIAAGAAYALFFSAGEYSMQVWISAYFVTALPGILVHLAMIPSIVVALRAARLLPPRREKRAAEKL